MTNIELAAKAMYDAEHDLQGHTCDVTLDRLRGYATALNDAGHLTPDPQIIRSFRELENLEVDTLVLLDDLSTTARAGEVVDDEYDATGQFELEFPVVVVASVAEVRAARTALQEATE